MYHVLLAETVSHCSDELQEMDEEGDSAMFVDEVAEGVSRCLAERQPDSEMRRLWLEALNAASDWEAYLQSLRLQYRHLPALQHEMRQARL